MNDLAQSLVLAFWMSLAAAALVTAPIYRWLLASNSRQTVSDYAPEAHAAKQGTPTMGGLIVIVGLVAGILAAGGAFRWVALTLLLGFGAVGFLDDFVVPRVTGKRGLGWKPKLGLQALVCVAAMALWSVDGMAWGWLVAGALVILFFANAYNFADGLDGLAGTLGVLLAVSLGALIALGGGVSLPPIAAALAAALLPFLALNAPPARVFMGDVGSLAVGSVLGLLAIGGFWDVGSPAAFAPTLGLYVGCVALASTIMFAELLPVPIQIFWVKAFKRRLFPFTPIHHAFEKAGWPESRVVWTFALAQFVVGAAALSWMLLAWRSWPGRL